MVNRRKPLANRADIKIKGAKIIHHLCPLIFCLLCRKANLYQLAIDMEFTLLLIFLKNNLYALR